MKAYITLHAGAGALLRGVHAHHSLSIFPFKEERKKKHAHPKVTEHVRKQAHPPSHCSRRIIRLRAQGFSFSGPKRSDDTD